MTIIHESCSSAENKTIQLLTLNYSSGTVVPKLKTNSKKLPRKFV